MRDSTADRRSIDRDFLASVSEGTPCHLTLNIVSHLVSWLSGTRDATMTAGSTSSSVGFGLGSAYEVVDLLAAVSCYG